MRSCWVLPMLCGVNVALALGKCVTDGFTGCWLAMLGIFTVNLLMSWPTARQRAEA